MSAQINLYHPRFGRQRELLALGNVVLAVVVVYTFLAVLGGWAWQEAASRRDAAATADAQLRAAREQVEAATKAAAIRKPSPQLMVELESADAMLRRRGEIAHLLESGAIGSAGGFSEYFRGLARQTPDGLWLTGFSIGSGGNDMEIRGSMMNSAALPEYIRRLGVEKAFLGRTFAALTMNRGDPPTATRPVSQQLANLLPAGVLAGTLPSAPVPVSTATPASGPRPIDFVLLPKWVEAKDSRQ